MYRSLCFLAKTAVHQAYNDYQTDFWIQDTQLEHCPFLNTDKILEKRKDKET